MPDLEARLRDLTTLTGSTKRPLGPEALDQQATGVRRAHQARLLVPVVVLAALAIMSTLVVVRNRSVVDVATTPATTDPGPAETQELVTVLRATLDLRTALNHEMVDSSVRTSRRSSTVIQDRRTVTDAALARFRDVMRVLPPGSDEFSMSLRSVETRLNGLAVTRKSIDQDQALVTDNVQQFQTTLNELTRLERTLANETTDLRAYKVLSRYALASDVVEAGSVVLALDTVGISQGGFDSPDGRSLECGPDPSNARPGCSLYESMVIAEAAYNDAVAALMDPRTVDTPADVKARYRAATVAEIDGLTRQVLAGGQGRNDLSAFSLDETVAAVHRQIDSWAAFQRSLLDDL